MAKNSRQKPIFLLAGLTVAIIIITLLAYKVVMREDETKDSSQNEDIPAKYEPLLAQVRRGFPVNVTIELNVEYHTEGLLPESEVQLQRDRIQLVREKLLEELAPYGVKAPSDPSFWVVPFVFLQIPNESALRKLIESPYVLQFDETSPGIPLDVNLPTFTPSPTFTFIGR